MCVLSPVDHSFHCQLVFAPRFHVWSENSTFAPSFPPSLLFLHSYYVCNLAISLALIHWRSVFPYYFKQKFWSNLFARSIIDLYFRDRIKKNCEKFKYIKGKYMTRNSTKENFIRYFRMLSSSKVDFSFLRRKKKILTLNSYSHV